MAKQFPVVLLWRRDETDHLIIDQPRGQKAISRMGLGLNSKLRSYAPWPSRQILWYASQYCRTTEGWEGHKKEYFLPQGIFSGLRGIFSGLRGIFLSCIFFGFSRLSDFQPSVDQAT